LSQDVATDEGFLWDKAAAFGAVIEDIVSRGKDKAKVREYLHTNYLIAVEASSKHIVIRIRPLQVRSC
jgi:hypothetical protein